MTDFQPLKDKVWAAAKADNKDEFEAACKALMEKAANDVWRLGWEIYPKKIEDVYELLDDIARWCHDEWQKAMECGDAPYEDVSPGEGPMLVKKLIQDAIEGKKNDEDEG